MEERSLERRQILGWSLALGAAATVAGCSSTPHATEAGGGEEDVGPAEDLMREHGVLNRTLLVYEECRRRIDEPKGGEVTLGVLAQAAELVQRFVHEYHEVLEEREVFPRLEKAGKLTDLTHVLRDHHAAGRAVTARIQALGGKGGSMSDAERSELSSRIADFVRMYRPHEAREDTVVFPTFHAMFTPKEWDALGDLFEGKEKETLGDQGFEHAVATVTGFEHTLGIDDLTRFTPKV
jgi:hemerythrin-like domain-containing protein